jgi:hypothetical protein
MLEGEVHVALRGHQLKAVADGEFVFHRHGRQLAVALAGKFADKLLALGNGVAVLVVLVVVVGMAAQEAFGIAAVRQAFQGFQQAGIERFAGGGIVDGLAVNLSGTRAVVMDLVRPSIFSECTPIWVRRSTWAMARRSFEFMM